MIGETTGPMWETAKGVMLSMTTLGVLWTARTVFAIRDDVRDLNVEVRGRDGKNGLKAQVQDLCERLEVIEARNLVIDAVASVEKEEYKGDERRHGLRDLRRIIRDEIETAREATPRKRHPE